MTLKPIFGTFFAILRTKKKIFFKRALSHKTLYRFLTPFKTQKKLMIQF